MDFPHELERTSGDSYWERNIYETCVIRLRSQFGPIAAEWLTSVA